MPILAQTTLWERKRAGTRRVNGMTDAELNNVRRALRVLQGRIGGPRKLAAALGINQGTLNNALFSAKHRPSLRMALPAARLMQIPLESLLAGDWTAPEVCPTCGHVALSRGGLLSPKR
jgi:transcriptional regulator with XRE-family HTH domain